MAVTVKGRGSSCAGSGEMPDVMRIVNWLLSSMQSNPATGMNLSKNSISLPEMAEAYDMLASIDEWEPCAYCNNRTMDRLLSKHSKHIMRKVDATPEGWMSTVWLCPLLIVQVSNPASGK
jgi:hypothetical protein